MSYIMQKYTFFNSVGIITCVVQLCETHITAPKVVEKSLRRHYAARKQKRHEISILNIQFFVTQFLTR
jgi:hypothetical protein